MSRPNILFVFTDQQRWDTCGLHGNPHGLTPNYDRLARQGTHLPHCFTVQPVCGPSRACLQTGTYATTNGSWKNGIPLDPELPCMGKLFSAAGYDTGYVGKWHLGSRDPVPADERGGYQYWKAANALEFSSDAYDCRVWDHQEQEVKLPGYRVDALADDAIRFMTEPRDRPFFLFLSLLEPHHQNHTDCYPAPRGYREAYRDPWIPPDLAALPGSTHRDLAGYYGMVKRIDEALGRLEDALCSNGLREDTIIAFTSDHACHFCTRNGEFKRSPHESSIRVPGFLSGPGFEAGGERTEMFSLIDFAPTLLDAAGIQIPANMQGRSLLPRLRGEADWPEHVFGQTSENRIGRYIRTQRWKYAVQSPNLEGLEASSDSEYEELALYDLEQDPYELDNLVAIPAYEHVRETLRRCLLEDIATFEAATPTILPTTQSPPERIQQRKPHPSTDHPSYRYAPIGHRFQAPPPRIKN